MKSTATRSPFSISLSGTASASVPIENTLRFFVWLRRLIETVLSFTACRYSTCTRTVMVESWGTVGGAAGGEGVSSG